MRRTWAAILLAAAVAGLTENTARTQDKEEPAAKVILVPDAGGHHAQIWQILFTPDSRRLVTISADRSVRIWDAETGTHLKTMWFPFGPGANGHLLTGSLSPDGRLLAVAGVGHGKAGGVGAPVYVLSMETYEVALVLKAHESNIFAVTFAPKPTAGEATLATGDASGKLLLWDLVRTKGVLEVKNSRTLVGHADNVEAIAFSPDGKSLVSVSHDKTGRVWSAATGKETAQLKLAGFRLRKTVAWGRGKAAKAEEELIAVSLADDDPKNPGNWYGDSFALWEPNGKFVRKVQHAGGTRGGTQWLGFGHTGLAVTAATIYADKVKISRFNINGKEGPVFADRNPKTEEAVYGPCAVSPNGKWLAAAGDRNRLINLFDYNTGELIRFFGGGGRQATEVGWKQETKNPNARAVVWRTALLPEGYAPAAPVGKGFYGRGFNFDLARPVAAGDGPFDRHRYELNGVSIKTARQSVEVFEKGKLVRALKGEKLAEEHWAREVGTTFITDRMVAISRGPSFAIWDPTTGKYLRNLKGHDGSILAAAPTADGKYVVGGGDDQVLHVWDPNKSDPLVNVFAAGPDWVAWTENGYYAASPSGDRLVGFVVNNGLEKLATYHPAERFRKQLNRPDVIKEVLKAGSVEKAVAEANKKLPKPPTGSAVAKVDDLLPPRVELTVGKVEGQKVTVAVKATAASEKQAIESLQLRLDGRPVGGAGFTLALKPAAKEVPRKEWTLDVPPGRHELSILVSTPETAAVSEPVAVVVDVPLAERPVLHLVAAAVNDYQNGIPPLTCAVNDAEALVKAFGENCAGGNNRFREVKVWPAGTGGKGKPLTNAAASRDAVLKALSDLRDNAKPGETAVFFFAGHGVVQGGEFYLLTSGANPATLKDTAISGADFREALAGIRCPTLVILDACHSASIVGNLQPATDEITGAATSEEVGVTVLTAARSTETAGELNGNGLFTRSLVAALTGKGVAYDSFDDTIYVHHLFTAVHDGVKRESKDKQHPHLQMPHNAPQLPIRKIPAPPKGKG